VTGTIITSPILADERVALSGRLASMTRREAIALVAEHGGQFATELSSDVTLLVVGSNGWPLAPDGRVSGKLRRARRLLDEGRPLVIVSEQQFLDRLVGERPAALYSLVQLSQILGIGPERLRAWVRAGLVRPARLELAVSYFDYGQVARAKSLADLVQAGIRPARLRQSLARLAQWVGGSEESFSQLAILERFGRVVVRLGSGALAEPNGQLRFEFSAESGLEICPFPERPVDAEDWFERGMRAEEIGDFSAAVVAYRRCLAAGGPAADAAYNLANALYALGKPEAAAERFRQVLELDPGFSEASNNLGVVLAELGDSEEALTAYRRAIESDAHFADAHFNLADALDDLGRHGEARRHWQAYLEFEADGPWSEHARERLSARPPYQRGD
jgi:tetratricopeptide (TPR) repeat protein